MYSRGGAPQEQANTAIAGQLEMRGGGIGYPAFQFDGRQQLEGVRDVVGLLSPVAATSWTVASWLTSPSPDLAGQRPLDALREGHVDAVVAAARRAARALAA